MKKFTFYLDNNALSVKVGDKLPMTVTGKAPNLLIYGVKDNVEVGPTICSDDPHDQNYLEADKMDALPDDINTTVVAVEDDFGVITIVISIDELEDK